LPAFVAELKVSEQAKQYSLFNPPTPPSRWARFYQSTLWPFILAAALALRLTKVTVEIGDWTADKKHPPTERAAA